MITIETDLALKEILEIDPEAWATPLDGVRARLPEQSTEASGRLVWRWHIRRRMTISHVRIRYADRTAAYSLTNPCRLRRGDTLEIIAALHQIR